MEFNHTISEKTFAFFIDHHAGSKYYLLPFLSVEKNTGELSAYIFIWDGKFKPRDEKEKTDSIVGSLGLLPQESLHKSPKYDNRIQRWESISAKQHVPSYLLNSFSLNLQWCLYLISNLFWLHNWLKQ